MDKEKDFKLKDSTELVGQLVPVTRSKYGELIDGNSRLAADKTWPYNTIDTVDTPLKLAIARLIINENRRVLSTKEKQTRLKEIWLEYKKEFKKFPEASVVAGWMGRSERWVWKYLPKEFKEKEKATAGEAGGKAKSAARRAAEKEAEKDAEETPAEDEPEDKKAGTYAESKTPKPKKEVQKFTFYRTIGPNEIKVIITIKSECWLTKESVDVELGKP